MIFLLVAILVILLIIKIIMLRKELKENKKRLWPIYFSSLFAEVTSIPVAAILQMELMGVTLALFAQFLFMYIFCLVENLLFLIVGIILLIKQKKKLKKKKLKEKNQVLRKVILTFLGIYIGILLIAFIPIIHKTKIEKYVEDYAIKYMTTKYGDGNFKAINITKRYSGGLFSPEVHNGYNVKMKTKYTDEMINVSIYGTTPEEIKISHDSLILTCYKIDGEYDYATNLRIYLNSEKTKIVENEYKNQFNIDINFNCNSEISDDYGHLPSMNDLINLCQINTQNIDITINDYVESSNELEYLKRLAKYSINYFNNEEIVKIDYTLNNKTGYIKITNNTVTIKIDDIERIYSKEEIKNFTN